jgi:hypothetical protein
LENLIEQPVALAFGARLQEEAARDERNERDAERGELARKTTHEGRTCVELRRTVLSESCQVPVSRARAGPRRHE